MRRNTTSASRLRKSGDAPARAKSKVHKQTIAPPLPVNPDLIWDYDLPAEEEQQSESFRRWYVARVLTRGRAEDIRAIGLHIVHAYLPQLTLPDKIRRFWEWYFSLPDVRRRYGITDSPAR